MPISSLATVANALHVLDQVARFNSEAPAHGDRGRTLLRQTRYWVQDLRIGRFGPSKFVGYQSLDFEGHEQMPSRNHEGAAFGGAEAPFSDARGKPHLEAHHTRRLAESGFDHPRFVAAVCPTCHRRAHHAADAAAYNSSIMSTAAKSEPTH